MPFHRQSTVDKEIDCLFKKNEKTLSVPGCTNMSKIDIKIKIEIKNLKVSKKTATYRCVANNNCTFCINRTHLITADFGVKNEF